MLMQRFRMCLQHVNIVIFSIFCSLYAYTYVVFHCGHIMTVVLFEI